MPHEAGIRSVVSRQQFPQSLGCSPDGYPLSVHTIAERYVGPERQRFCYSSALLRNDFRQLSLQQPVIR